MILQTDRISEKHRGSIPELRGVFSFGTAMPVRFFPALF